MEYKGHINSVEQLLSTMFAVSEGDFFRGHSRADYRLVPSIGRLFKNNVHIIPQFERQIFDDFKRKYSLFCDARLSNDFDFLFLAQHHGLPTRLLDWTYNPLVALYFATASNFDEDGCLYHSFPRKMIYNYEKDWNPFSVKENILVLPNLTNIRYKNQNGLFMLYADPHIEDKSISINKYLIPKGYKKTIQQKLRKIGITKSFLFPSLDSLCSDIMDMYMERYGCYM